MTDTFGYALYTFQTGGRPLSAFNELFEELASRLDSVGTDQGSSTQRSIEIALSDTTILMVYSIVEGFFFEEYCHYLGDKRPDNLQQAMDRLSKHFDICNPRFVENKERICSLRSARNAIVHRNGILKDAEKQLLASVFGNEISLSSGYAVANVELLRSILSTAHELLTVYSEVALSRARA